MSVTLDLDGKVALITGGSRGIGASCVRLFRQAGAKVAFNYQRSQQLAEALVRECGAEDCAAFQASLDGHADGEARLVRSVVARFGRLDILVVNHGVWPPREVPVDEMSREQWRSTLACNLDSVFELVKHSVAAMKTWGLKPVDPAAAPGGKHAADELEMKGRRSGQIVLVSSTAGQRGEAFHCDYAASKGAIISMVKGLSTELAGHGIRVNCVAPGWVNTDMAAPALNDPAMRERVFGVIPLGRVASPEEIAAPILFLCTAHAGFITGEVFNVNGGAVLPG
jgi:3-oxoacyl-[acyl-carrier protein] reductase